MKVKITLTTQMLGTVPKDKEIYSTYIESKKPIGNFDEEVQDVPEIEEKGWTGFLHDESGLYVLDYFVKGFLKHSANVQKEFLKVKALRAKIDDFVFVFPRKIHLGKMEPDGVIERPIRFMTAQGPRVALARSDYVVAGTPFEFELELFPPHKEITADLVGHLLSYGRLMGFGQFRNGGYGRFTFEIEQ